MRSHVGWVSSLTISCLTLSTGASAQEPPTPTGCPSLESLGFTESAREATGPVTAIERVSRAKVTAAQARRITMMNPILSLVTVSGATLRPVPGTSIWKLTNGSFAILDSEPTANAMEVWTKDMGDGDLYVRACLCPGYNANVDDGCKFSDGGNPTNPGSCGGNTCCGIVEGVILGNGTPITF